MPIDRYLDGLTQLRKLSAATVSCYRRDLHQLAQMATALVPGIEVSALQHAQVRRLTSQLHAQGLNPRSIARKLSAWRGYFDWLAEHAIIDANPVDGVKPPKRGKPLPKALSADDAVRLVQGRAATVAGSDDDPLRGACDHAMFELLYSSGLRVSELAQLDAAYCRVEGYESAGWIDLAAGEVTVTGKGSKKRTVPVGRAAVTALRDWLAIRPADSNALASHRHALFLNSQARRVSVRLIQLRLKAHAQRVGIASNVHPHVLRHSFATHVLQSSGDLRAVQEMMGHASIASTQIYTALDFQRLAAVYDLAHPRAKKIS
ncbi:MAG: tyrosine recombinase XerC [Pseudomonadota bacterium]|nr:tyrosine recombinase XerC [Pseudomonadota bacterium]